MEKLENKLVGELDNLITILNKYEETKWSTHFSKMKELVSNKNILGIDSLRNLHRGGMGSFNDFYLSKKNGDRNDLISDNSKILKLSKSISNLAQRIKIEY